MNVGHLTFTISRSYFSLISKSSQRRSDSDGTISKTGETNEARMTVQHIQCIKRNTTNQIPFSSITLQCFFSITQ